MDEVPKDDNQTVEYQKEIQELRLQIQQLQEAENLKDYSGKTHCFNFSCLVSVIIIMIIIGPCH